MKPKSKKASNKNASLQVTNWRLLLTTVVVIGIASPLVYLWHSHCVASMGSYFSDRAALATELAKQKEEIESLEAEQSFKQETDEKYARMLKEFDLKLKEYDKNLSSKQVRPNSYTLWSQAAKSLGMYQRIDRNNAEIRGRLAIAYSKSREGQANPRRVAELHAQAAALMPNQRNEFLVKAANSYAAGLDFANAQQKLNEISSTDSLSGEQQALLAKVRAQTAWGQVFLTREEKFNPELGDYIAQAIELNPEDLELPVYLALLYRQEEFRNNLSSSQIAQIKDDDNASYQKKAEQIMDSMIQRNPNSANALLQRHKYRASLNPFTSLTDLEKAAQMEPANADVQFALGKSKFNQYKRRASNNLSLITSDPTSWPSELLQSKEHFEFCQKTTPDRLDTYLYLGELERILQNFEGAINVWLLAINRPVRTPNDSNTLLQIRQNLIVAMIDQFNPNQVASQKWLDQAEQQLALLDQFITQSENLSGSPEALFELSQSRKFMGAALLAKRGEYGSAIDLLEPAIRNENNSPSGRTLVMARLLGNIYSRLGLDSQAAKTYENALGMTDNESLKQEMTKLALEARQKTGRNNTADTNVQPPASDNQSAEDWYQHASFLLQVEANKPYKRRDLTTFNDAMKRLNELSESSEAEDSWRFPLLALSAESLTLKDTNFTVAELVERVRQLEPSSSESDRLSIRLAEIYAKLDKRDSSIDLTTDVKRMLRQYESLSEGSAKSYVLTANVLITQNKPDAAKEKIKEGLRNPSLENKRPLRLAMISLLLTGGDVKEAFNELHQLASDFPDSPELTMRLATLCIQFPILNTDQPADWEERLLKIEGTNGAYTKCIDVIRSLRTVNRSNDADDLTSNRDKLNQAKEHCRSIVAQRPNWHIGHTMTGQVLLAQSVNLRETNRTTRNLDETSFEQLRASALSALTRAVELGESRRWVLVPLAQMQSPEDRNKTLEMLRPETIVRDPDLLRMQVSMSIAGNDKETALNTVKFATKADPKNALNWLTLAAIQLNLGKSDEALQSCQTARSASKEGPEDERQRTMRNLYNFYGTASQFGPQPSTTTWEQKALEIRPSVLASYTGAEKSFEKARMLALVKDPAAGAEFVKAVDANPKNKDHLKLAIEYFTTGNATNVDAFAEGLRMCQLLKQLPNLDDRERLKYVWVEANLYAKRGTKEDWQALKLLFSENNIDQSAPNASEYSLLLAVLLLTKDAVTNSERQKNLTEAFSLVENGRNPSELVLGGQIKQLLAPFQPDEQTKLDFISDARERFNEAALSNDLLPNQLATAVNFFIDQKEWDSAEQFLTKLKTSLGDSLEENLPAIGLQAQLLKQKGKDPSEIIEIVNAFGDDLLFQVSNTSKMNQARQCQRIADLLTNIDESNAALKWSEKAVAIEPRYRLALAMENNKLGNKDKAVELCLAGYADTNQINYLIALTQVLITGKTDPIHFEQGNAAFEKAMQRKDLSRNQRVNLLMSIANVRIAGENRTQDAIAIYEKANQILPGNLLILNNLATAYSETPEQLDVAIKHINQAISRHGNRPELLDTKSVIFMKQGKLTEALALLTDITNLNSDPRYWWHRAEVEFKIHETTADSSFLEAARKHYKIAQSLKLANQIFTPNEETRLANLEKNLSVPKPPAADTDALNPVQSSSSNQKHRLEDPAKLLVTT